MKHDVTLSKRYFGEEAVGKSYFDALATLMDLLETHDGARIYVRYTGVMEFSEAAVAALAEGRSTEFGDTLFLTQVRFECGTPGYEWLSHTIAVGEGRMHPDCVEYAIYEVTHG
jgi:hypothetical protein